MWGTAAPTPVHGLHMSFTIGTAIVPPIAVPFLSPSKRDNLTRVETELSTGEGLLYGNHSTSAPYSGHVKSTYVLYGAWGVLVAIIFLVLFLKTKPYTSIRKSSQKLKFKDVINPARIAGGSFIYGLCFLISLFFLYVIQNGRDKGMYMYLFVIAHEDVLQMSKPMAALLVTCYNLFTAVGRGLGALISHWLPIKPFLFIQLIFAAFFQMLLFFYGLDIALTTFKL